MNNHERDIIIKLIEEKLNDDEFLEKFTVDIKKDYNYFDKILNDSIVAENGEDLGLIFYIGFAFDLFKERHIEILNKLILEYWHMCHEDIAILFQYFESNLTVESLYEATLTKPEYLNYTDAFAVKCIWTLGDINTVESKEKLRLLTKSKNRVIKKNAKEQLKRYK